jgi:peptide deformylase
VTLRYYGDPVLRQRSEEITELTDEVKAIIGEMIEVASSARAVGVSAVQLGYLVRAFVLCIDTYSEDGTRVPGEPRVFINPKLSDPDEEMAVMEEGCLSIPGLYIPVERPVRITLEALDENLEPFREVLEDFPARAVMHENDHLNGVLTIDRTPRRLRQRFEPQLRAIKKKYGS